MKRRFANGELRLAVLGDLYRHPSSTYTESAERLLVSDANTVRVVLSRMVTDELVQRVTDQDAVRYTITGKGLMLCRRIRALLP